MTEQVFTVKSFDRFFINNEWSAPSSTATFEVINPATEQSIATVPAGQSADIDSAVMAAREAFDHGPWPRMSASERADCMQELSTALQRDIPGMASVITQEMGCPISFSTAGQTFAPIMVLDYYAGVARNFPFEQGRQGMMGPVVVRQEAVGVVAAITPWNVPLFTTMLKLAPALAAGCTVVLKPAQETPLDAYALAEALATTSIPPGVVNIVPADREVSQYLVSHPGVDKVTFTGSTAAGRKIGAICGQQLKRCTLELGGKSAAIILDDSDLDTLVPQLLPSAMMNTGQACVAQTRILASHARYQDTVDALVAAVGALNVGDPMDQACDIGPLFASHHRDRVESYIALGKEEGATIATGGGRPAGLDKGWYVEPTIFSNVDNSMRIAQEEIFGPAVVVIPYSDEAEAVAIANDSNYGLSGSVWCNDVEQGLNIARQVRTGTYGVNGQGMDFHSPFGGFKQSGLGRELGPEGLGEFCEYKTITLPADYTPQD
ncbi:Geranial dehydrogenase [Halioglobus japonicus]|nr:Geranial dehydrogenase [Halioglobus japonicus]